MTDDTRHTNRFVLEYQGNRESTEATFNHLIRTITEKSPGITGFRLELTTARSFDGPFEMVIEQDGQRGISGETEGETNEIPVLQSDALPAQVLTLMCDGDEEMRSSDLQDEFDDEIDTARISQTLASLKRRELVAAKPDPEDKRANIYWPTEMGKQALGEQRNKA